MPSTLAGDIRSDGVSGAVVADTAGGDIRILRVGGSLDAKTAEQPLDERAPVPDRNDDRYFRGHNSRDAARQEHDHALSVALEPPKRQLDIDRCLVVGLAAQADRSQVAEPVTPERISAERELHGAARGAAFGDEHGPRRREESAVVDRLCEVFPFDITM